MSSSVSTTGNTDQGGGKHHTSSPTNPAQPDIRIVVQVAEFGTDVRVTASRVTATGLSEHALPAHTAQIGCQWRERVVHSVRNTFRRRAARTIEILMHLIDQFVSRSVTIQDAGQSWGRGGLEAANGVVVCAREEDHLGRGAVATNRMDDLLERGSPFGHVKFVRLVHQAEDDVALRGVFLSELAPEVGELVVRDSALADDAAVPTGVIVHVEDAEGPGCETRLHDLVVGAEEAFVQRTSKDVVDEILPSDGKAKEVERVILRKMLHLRGSYRAWAVRARRVSLPMFSIDLHPA